MTPIDARIAVVSLKTFITQLVADGVRDKADYRDWRKVPSNEMFMEACFRYVRNKGMPSIGALVSPFFHPSYKLIGCNYTPVAHNTLHRFHEGWTMPLRLCRGIVFDHRGNVVAKPFEKFFNAGEHEETRKLPDMPFEATEKLDGHLGIVFRWQSRFILTTRGSFTSPTTPFANEMLASVVARRGWAEKFPRGKTLLVEIVHPKTKVHLDYGRKKRLVALAAYDNISMEELPGSEVRALAKRLGIPAAKVWEGTNIAHLAGQMKDREVNDQEGFVVRYTSGRRVKLKFESYVGKMVSAKLTYAYIMNRSLSGNPARMLDTLDFEQRVAADRMVANMLRVHEISDEKAQKEYLYALDPERSKSQYYRGICRKYLASLQQKAA